MVIDIGGGTTDIAVISLGTSVISDSLNVAGDEFNEAIIRYLKKYNGIIIGERTAENLKINYGSLTPRENVEQIEVRGRSIETGLPGSVIIDTNDLRKALLDPAEKIVKAVIKVLEETPPELAADISDRGIYMTGGGCLIYGFDRLLKERTGVNVMIANDPITCVALGTGKSLDNLDVL